MTRLLKINSSSRTEASTTRSLLSEFVNAWQEAHPQDSVVSLDLIEEQVPFVSAAGIQATYKDASQRTREEKEIYGAIEPYSRALLESDLYVMAVPMYNFTVPAVFKAFIDAVVLPGVTFKITEGGYEGLLKNKRAVVVTASGGNYDSAPMAEMDFLEPYLRALFGFLGVTDITFVKVQGHDQALVERQKAEARNTLLEYVRNSKTAAAVE
jgi:FMN-dependent NADH-azoreductase